MYKQKVNNHIKAYKTCMIAEIGRSLSLLSSLSQTKSRFKSKIQQKPTTI